MREPVFFGVPLIARAVSPNWLRIERLFGLMLNSILAQSDPDFRLFLAAHEAPTPWQRVAGDPRFALIKASWPPEPVTAANDDGGRKNWLIKQAVRERGGGLLMLVDADDWVNRDLIRILRQTVQQEHIGAVVADGYALDYQSRRLTAFPVKDVFEGAFHELCGSSVIARLGPTDAADPYVALGSHHEWETRAETTGLKLARLSTSGVYMVGTGQNHSETQGPFASWRREVTAAVRRSGMLLTTEFAEDFGQSEADLKVFL